MYLVPFLYYTVAHCYRNDAEMSKIARVFEIWLSEQLLSPNFNKILAQTNTIGDEFRVYSNYLFNNQADQIFHSYQNQIQFNVNTHNNFVSSLGTQPHHQSNIGQIVFINSIFL